LNELCTYARQYAAHRGRRRAILFTSHCAGRAHEGRELLDYAAFPSRMRYGNSASGMEINTAHADAGVRDLIGVLEDMSDLPVLLEIDNYACAPSPPIGSGAYDEITGFAAKPPLQRRAFLRQYYNEVRTWRNLWCNQRVYLALPDDGTFASLRARATATRTSWSPTRWVGTPPTVNTPATRTPSPPCSAAVLRRSNPCRPPRPRPLQPSRLPAPWLGERFDAYKDGDIAGQGKWTKDPGKSSAVVQGAFAKAGKALRIDTRASDAIENRLTFSLQAGGTHHVSFDLAMVDRRPEGSRTEVTMIRMTLRNGLPNAELLPNSGLLFLYWGSRGRLVYRGNPIRRLPGRGGERALVSRRAGPRSGLYDGGSAPRRRFPSEGTPAPRLRKPFHGKPVAHRLRPEGGRAVLPREPDCPA